jgi:hypothetical protein
MVRMENRDGGMVRIETKSSRERYAPSILLPGIRPILLSRERTAKRFGVESIGENAYVLFLNNQ